MAAVSLFWNSNMAAVTSREKGGPSIAREFSIDRDNLYLSTIKIKIKLN